MTPPRPPRRVLIVDDYEDSAETTGLVLGLHGYDVRTARSADEALAHLGDWQPDVCLLDIRMPRLSGYDLAELICDRLGRRPVLFAASGDSSLTDRDARRLKLFDRHFLKPVDPAFLAQQIERHCPAAS